MKNVNIKKQSLRRAALEYAANGIAVLPLDPDTQRPAYDYLGDGDSTTDPVQIEEWWNENPNFLIGHQFSPGIAAIFLRIDPV